MEEKAVEKEPASGSTEAKPNTINVDLCRDYDCHHWSKFSLRYANDDEAVKSIMDLASTLTVEICVDVMKLERILKHWDIELTEEEKEIAAELGCAAVRITCNTECDFQYLLTSEETADFWMTLNKADAEKHIRELFEIAVK